MLLVRSVGGSVFHTNRSRKDSLDYLAFHVRQPEVPAAVAICQALVIQT